ncbi:MAG: C25 family cysteine peptidase [Bacteroidota bacterium]|jgi:hypothetical protein
MRKTYFLIILLTCIFLHQAKAQTYGNEWIAFSPSQTHSTQQYFKVKVWREGLYRITYADLSSVSFPMPFNPARVQVFHHGKEQFIRVEDGGDGAFDATDFIEFYGFGNDGKFDSLLYRNPSHQPHTRFSHFTDTAAYYITLNADTAAINRRMPLEADTNYTAYSPIPWIWTESINDYRNDYVMRNLANIKDSEYDAGEGWYGGAWTSGPINISAYAPNFFTGPGAPLARFSAAAMGGNNTGLQHSLTIDVGGVSLTKYFTGYEFFRFDSTVASNSGFPLPTVPFTFSLGTGVNNRTHLSFVKLKYPHNPDFADYANVRKFSLDGAFGSSKALMQINNVNVYTGSQKVFIFSGDTVKSVVPTVSGNNIKAIVSLYGSEKSCSIVDSVMLSQNGMFFIQPVNTDPADFARFRNFGLGNGSDFLIVTDTVLSTAVSDYSSYKSSRGYTPLVAYDHELYDQFSYGIEQHPLAIRNFCKYAHTQFSLKPGYLLLIGKSVSQQRIRYTGFNNYNNCVNNWNMNKVPTFGVPASDMLFTCFSSDTLPRSVFPVGRISAVNNNDVSAYLDKLIAFESAQQQCPQEWQKRILHFGGGNTGAQQVQIQAMLSDYEQIVRDTLMGAFVKTFLKTSTDPIQVDLSQYLQSLIDSGSTLMTFVAHASGTSFDISTDIPQNYNNKDRYPLVLANSCFVGDIHDASRRIAEDFVLLPDKGAIGFLAQPDIGLLDNLQYYSREFYTQLALESYGNSLGQIMRAVNDSVLALPFVTSNFNGYFIFKSVLTGMTLSGDPSIILNAHQDSDYQIDNSSISFSPSFVTSDLDSFTVNVVVKNLGRATRNPFVVHLQRIYPDGSTVAELDTVIDYVSYLDTIRFRLPVESSKSVGPNSLSVYVDYLNNVNECDESNNTVLNVLLNIKSSDIAPVYPPEFAIVPQASGFKLKASTVDPFAAPRNYKFQIDTVRTFNSPFRKQGLVFSGGGVVVWQPPFNLQPDRVYYWRVSRDSLPTDTIHPEWKESSFIHKSGITGWSQAHYSQFVKDDYTNVIYSESFDSTYKFVTTFSSLEVNNYLYISASYNPNFKIDNVVIDYAVCTAAPSMHIVVIDSLSLKAWSTKDHTFGEANRFDHVTNAPIPPCNGRGRPDNFFIFRMNDAASRDSMYNMLQNGIPTGNYVIAYTSFGGVFSTWSNQLKSLFTSWGSDSINFLNDTQPYIFFTKKGDPSYAQEAIGGPAKPAIQVLATLGGNWSKGFVESVPIGPSNGWTELHWSQSSQDGVVGKDSSYVDIIGITPTGDEVDLPAFSKIPPSVPTLDISGIDANLYPRLKLRAYLQDDSLFTPPQLKRWQIYHVGVPEFAWNASKFFSINKDTLQEGEDMEVRLAVENVGEIDADSLLVGSYVFDASRIRHDLPSKKYEALVVGDTLIATVRFNTLDYPGLNSLWLEANPGPDQLERYRFNNLAEIPFRVSKDMINPLLDVTFDGVHIMNGDIVSAKPSIRIRLKDENPYLAIDDTSDWQVFIKDPVGNSRKLTFELNSCSGTGTEQMKWCLGSQSGNVFNIEFNPLLLEDGIYELSVQATDASGNLSGSGSYKINFEVINKSSITEVINYPNPFSTSTKFVFTLTGSEVPDDFRIQIMTVRGTVVREISRDEIGPLRIGRNITEFAWNGKDEFGDQLANGVYLYRVISRINGVGVEKRTSDIDKYFVKGWGKMYLLR